MYNCDTVVYNLSMTTTINTGDQVRLLDSDDLEIYTVTAVDGTRLEVKASDESWGVIRVYEIERV